VRRVVLRATAVSVLAGLLLVALVLLCATAPVRHSGFGRRMERRFPVRWSQMALAFGSADEQVVATETLGATESREALPALRRAATSRLRDVRGAAVCGIEDIGQAEPRLAVAELTALSQDHRPEVRRDAYSVLFHHNRIAGSALDEALPDTLLRGLTDSDPGCRRLAAWGTVRRWGSWHQDETRLREALQACLLGPSPPPYCNPSGQPGSASDGHYVAELARGLHAPWSHERCKALVGLWEEGTPRSRQIVREYLAQHPLAEARR